MKRINYSLRLVVLILSGLVLFQSCSAYRIPITLEQAAEQENAVKIISIDDDALKYKYIVYEGGQFYGVKDNPGKDVKFLINTEEIEKVLSKKGFPWWGYMLIIGVVFTGIVLMVSHAELSDLSD